MLPLDKFLYKNSGKKIVLLGKGELFTREEYVAFLKKSDIEVVTRLEEGVVGIIEHHRISHVEELISCDAYVRDIPIYKLSEFEKIMSLSLVDAHILMSLKLKNDQKRLYQLLHNPYINDSLFLKLIPMYVWDRSKNSDNNEDRGVIIATLRRFLEFKVNEEDLLYSHLTLNRLVRDTTNPDLLYALLYFPDYKFLQKGKQWVTLREIIANSSYINQKTINKLLNFRDRNIPFYLSANPATPIEILKKFANNYHETEIDEALASNTTIDHTLFIELLSNRGSVREVLLTYQPIDNQRFSLIEAIQIEESEYSALGENILIEKDVLNRLVKRTNPFLLQSLASNPSLDATMIDILYKKNPNKYDSLLAGNPSASKDILKNLYQKNKNNQFVLSALASNVSTPISILQTLFELEIFEINEALASNESLPLEFLNILKIDTRLRHALTNNHTFTASITQSLGL